MSSPTCTHSFPDPFPQPISQIGDCRDCGISYEEAKDAARRHVVDRLNHLHAISDLDWGLIANLTGVSLNAVHYALIGRGFPFPPRAAERLEALITVVESSPATTPEGRHDWMFQTIEGGQTRIQWFAALGRRNRIPLQGSGYTPAQLLGAQTDGDQP